MTIAQFVKVTIICECGKSLISKTDLTGGSWDWTNGNNELQLFCDIKCQGVYKRRLFREKMEAKGKLVRKDWKFRRKNQIPS